MTRYKNEGIGKSGEIRVRKILEEYGQVSDNLNHNAHPDFYWKPLVKTSRYAIECKTMQASLSGKNRRMGMAKLSIQEYLGMCKLRDKNTIPAMIVEIRPVNVNPCDYVYIYIPWENIMELYKDSTPLLRSLQMYWILRKGVNLRWLLKNQFVV
jgi:hypothetical protein